MPFYRPQSLRRSDPQPAPAASQAHIYAPPRPSRPAAVPAAPTPRPAPTAPAPVSAGDAAIMTAALNLFRHAVEGVKAGEAVVVGGPNLIAQRPHVWTSLEVVCLYHALASMDDVIASMKSWEVDPDMRARLVECELKIGAFRSLSRQSSRRARTVTVNGITEGNPNVPGAGIVRASDVPAAPAPAADSGPRDMRIIGAVETKVTSVPAMEHVTDVIQRTAEGAVKKARSVKRMLA